MSDYQSSYTWLNGRLITNDTAAVPVGDTGLLHGAGVFTTMRAANGVAVWLEQHLARVEASCRALGIPLPYHRDELSDAVDELLRENNLSDARVRLTVTRGVISNDPVHGPTATPSVFITAAAFEPYAAELYERGMTVAVNDTQRLNPYDVQAGHKTLDYFSRFAALREAAGKQCQESLWFNIHNHLQSGSISNVFLVKDGRLLTPPTQEELRDEAVQQRTPYPRSNVLPGTTRAAVLEIAAQNEVQVELRGIDIATLLEADEVFLTNSQMLVMPVTRVEQKQITAVPGGVTMMVREKIEALLG